ncbi:MAG: NAD-dependent protein deacetylase [Gammaproteobacteria bacterium]|nr:NAD-dependent protein deacetylase [Gammaproteobacteria bacterium]
MSQPGHRQLERFLSTHPRLAVLAGAGCSTGSGIPDYRDDNGEWKHAKPVQFADFLRDADVRKRYWARSFAGWGRIASARPNAAHTALAALEEHGFVERLITQNVDNLHRRAGSRRVIDLHGVLDKVRCLDCDLITGRPGFQRRLQDVNAEWVAEVTAVAPDGDAALSRSDFSSFVVPECPNCGGILKPDVVFFGESVPARRVQEASDAVSNADALLVVGSSLMVFSGFRFARIARELGKPIAIVNRGVTRADDMANLKIREDCTKVLPAFVERIAA